MKTAEPKVKATIIARPAYKANGEIYETSSVRWIGEIYVYGKKVYTSSDCDGEGEAFNRCAAHIVGYEKNHGTSFFLDAKMDRLKK